MTRKIIFNEEQQKEIRDLYCDKRIKVKYIAPLLNASESTIFKFLKDNGLSRTASESKTTVTEEDKIRAIDIYKEGYSLEDTAKIANLTPDKVRRIIERAGIMRLPSDKNTVKFTDKEEQLCVDLYNSGVSIRKIVKELSTSKGCVIRTIEKYNLEKHDKYASIYSIDDNFFDSINTEEKAYFFGLLYADGCNLLERNRIIIGLIEQDKHILEKLLKSVKCNRPLSFLNLNDKNKNHNNVYKARLHNKHMCEVLNDYGLTPRKSLTKKFPEVIKNSSEDIIRHFIRGYFDGNGGIYIRSDGYHAEIYFYSTLDMCESINKLLIKYLNINGMHIKQHGSISKLFTAKHDYIINICNWLYKDSDNELCIYRKKKLYEKIL